MYVNKKRFFISEEPCQTHMIQKHKNPDPNILLPLLYAKLKMRKSLNFVILSANLYGFIPLSVLICRQFLQLMFLEINQLGGRLKADKSTISGIKKNQNNLQKIKIKFFRVDFMSIFGINYPLTDPVTSSIGRIKVDYKQL